MGRQSWGSSNLAIKNSLYHSCFRARSGLVCNFSMSNYIRTNISPQLYNGNSGSTNSKISTYVCNKSYVYGIALVNSSPSRGTSSVRTAGVTQILSSSTNGATLGSSYNVISSSYSYIQVRFTASSGNQFDGWRAGSSGGPLITTSTSYNAYYNNSYIINYTKWYARTSVAAPPRYTTAYPYGTSSFGACNATSYMTFYVSTAYSALTAPKIYANSTGNTGAPVGFYSNGFYYRYFNGSSFPFPQSFCGF